MIDNFDSFTYNVVHYLAAAGAAPLVFRNDAVNVAELAALAPDAIVLSPGPGTPDESGVCLSILEAAKAGQLTMPILGVCLGHQAIGQVFGARVVRAADPRHGQPSAIAHDGSTLFAGVPSPVTVGRYHSLVIDPATVTTELIVTAVTDDGIIMAIEHQTLPIYGVQFHPESVLTDFGQAMINNFVATLGTSEVLTTASL